jgi:hypothetical protein
MHKLIKVSIRRNILEIIHQFRYICKLAFTLLIAHTKAHISLFLYNESVCNTRPLGNADSLKF